jgi:hypothetical protein
VCECVMCECKEAWSRSGIESRREGELVEIQDTPAQRRPKSKAYDQLPTVSVKINR